MSGLSMSQLGRMGQLGPMGRRRDRYGAFGLGIDIFGGPPTDSQGNPISLDTPEGVPVHTAGEVATQAQLRASNASATALWAAGQAQARAAAQAQAQAAALAQVMAAQESIRRRSQTVVVSPPRPGVVPSQEVPPEMYRQPDQTVQSQVAPWRTVGIVAGVSVLAVVVLLIARGGRG